MTKNLDAKQEELKQLAHYQNEFNRLTELVTQQERELARQRQETELAQATAQLHTQEIFELRTAQARVTSSEDEEARLRQKILSSSKEHTEIQAKLIPRESEIQELVTKDSEKECASLSEVLSLKIQLAEREKVVQSHARAFMEARTAAELRSNELREPGCEKNCAVARKSGISPDRLSVIPSRKQRRKALREITYNSGLILTTLDHFDPLQSEAPEESCVRGSSIGAAVSGVPSPDSENDLQFVLSSPMLDDISNSSPRTSVLCTIDAPDATISDQTVPIKTVVREVSQEVDTQNAASPTKIVKPALENQETVEKVGHTNVVDLVADHCAKRQAIQTNLRPPSQPPNTSNKRKQPSLPSAGSDSQSQSMQRLDPRSILKASTLLTGTSSTEVHEGDEFVQTRSKKQRRSTVQDLGPILSSSPTASYGINGKRKLSHRLTKNSESRPS